MSIFTQFFKNNDAHTRKQAFMNELMRREAELTRDIFGKVPADTRREFFCLDKQTWIWYEEWTDSSGQRQQVTTRYMLYPKEILKSQNGGTFQRLTIDEAENFVSAIRVYQQKVKTQLYTPKPLAQK